ncbi:Rap1-interacting factor 1 N terminal-domain-containing protein [Dimargaris cristalligena]|uniref:Rap1-interacting factor 1 N terminal-domain-containing protein n=1 Tax=Dimargaris cristalligena TaxID=215637 RepID=A0A4P9ZXJ6_9FUNG|nr:Rap1-interacting factor 1 N terminal-domain-containing protein [Dimargaris cristalligena]|eukprot:RKP38386.1 Rap1-interacting factor 1 N terminal-domain-containing protein [Dimargaris cristalligena]
MPATPASARNKAKQVSFSSCQLGPRSLVSPLTHSVYSPIPAGSPVPRFMGHPEDSSGAASTTSTSTTTTNATTVASTDLTPVPAAPPTATGTPSYLPTHTNPPGLSPAPNVVKGILKTPSKLRQYVSLFASSPRSRPAADSIAAVLEAGASAVSPSPLFQAKLRQAQISEAGGHGPLFPVAWSPEDEFPGTDSDPSTDTCNFAQIAIQLWSAHYQSDAAKTDSTDSSTPLSKCIPKDFDESSPMNVKDESPNLVWAIMDVEQRIELYSGLYHQLRPTTPSVMATIPVDECSSTTNDHQASAELADPSLSVEVAETVDTNTLTSFPPCRALIESAPLFLQAFHTDLKESSNHVISLYALRCLVYWFRIPECTQSVPQDQLEAVLNWILERLAVTQEKTTSGLCLNCIANAQVPSELIQELAPRMVSVTTQILRQCPKSVSIKMEALVVLERAFTVHPPVATQYLSDWFNTLIDYVFSDPPMARMKSERIMRLVYLQFVDPTPQPHEKSTDKGPVDSKLTDLVFKNFLTNNAVAVIDAMNRLFAKGEEKLVTRVWGILIAYLGRQLHKSAMLNPFLKVLEKAFNSRKADVKTTAFRHWRCLIYTLSLDGNLFHEKRVRLIMVPLINCFMFEKNRCIRSVCLRTWVTLVYALGTHLGVFFSIVVEPLLPRALTDPFDEVRSLALYSLEAMVAPALIRLNRDRTSTPTPVTDATPTWQPSRILEYLSFSPYPPNPILTPRWLSYTRQWGTPVDATSASAEDGDPPQAIGSPAAVNIQSMAVEALHCRSLLFQSTGLDLATVLQQFPLIIEWFQFTLGKSLQDTAIEPSADLPPNPLTWSSNTPIDNIDPTNLAITPSDPPSAMASWSDQAMVYLPPDHPESQIDSTRIPLCDNYLASVWDALLYLLQGDPIEITEASDGMNSSPSPSAMATLDPTGLPARPSIEAYINALRTVSQRTDPPCVAKPPTWLYPESETASPPTDDTSNSAPFTPPYHLSELFLFERLVTSLLNSTHLWPLLNDQCITPAGLGLPSDPTATRTSDSSSNTQADGPAGKIGEPGDSGAEIDSDRENGDKTGAFTPPSRQSSVSSPSTLIDALNDLFLAILRHLDRIPIESNDCVQDLIKITWVVWAQWTNAQLAQLSPACRLPTEALTQCLALLLQPMKLLNPEDCSPSLLDQIRSQWTLLFTRLIDHQSGIGEATWGLTFLLLPLYTQLARYWHHGALLTVSSSFFWQTFAFDIVCQTLGTADPTDIAINSPMGLSVFPEALVDALNSQSEPTLFLTDYEHTLQTATSFLYDCYNWLDQVPQDKKQLPVFLQTTFRCICQLLELFPCYFADGAVFQDAHSSLLGALRLWLSDERHYVADQTRQVQALYHTELGQLLRAILRAMALYTKVVDAKLFSIIMPLLTIALTHKSTRLARCAILFWNHLFAPVTGILVPCQADALNQARPISLCYLKSPKYSRTNGNTNPATLAFRPSPIRVVFTVPDAFHQRLLMTRDQLVSQNPANGTNSRSGSPQVSDESDSAPSPDGSTNGSLTATLLPRKRKLSVPAADVNVSKPSQPVIKATKVNSSDTASHQHRSPSSPDDLIELLQDLQDCQAHTNFSSFSIKQLLQIQRYTTSLSNTIVKALESKMDSGNA